jgi:hypothetical protein
MCVPLVPQRHAHLSCALNLSKIQFVSCLNENSNIVISKLRDVCRTQSYDPLRGLDVI